MKSLPFDVYLDILKCLNYNQLNSMQQSNSYFYVLIDKYKEELALKEFYSMHLVSWRLYDAKEPESNSETDDFQLTEALKIKWENAIQKHIALYENTFMRAPFDILDDNYKNNNIANLFLLSKDSDKVPNLRLPLVRRPQNIEQMLNFRYWFKMLSNCFFENIVVEQGVLNSYMLNLLFDGMPKQLLFNAKTFFMYSAPFSYDIYGYEFMNNHVVSEGVYLNVNDYEIKKLFGKKTRDEERYYYSQYNEYRQYMRVANYDFVSIKNPKKRIVISVFYEIGSNKVSAVNLGEYP